MNVFQLAKQFKGRLLSQERMAAGEMIKAYGSAYQAISGQLEHLTEQIALAREAGQEVSQGWLFREERLQALLRQARAQMQRFCDYADHSIAGQQREAVHQAELDAHALTRAALPESVTIAAAWNRLPAGAMEHLIGTLQNGSPLRTLFAGFGEDAADGIQKALIRGVALGQGGREIARGVRNALGGNLTRALTISRTETLRSYRAASIASYAANDDVVQRWRWTCSKSSRTCIVCLMMDGQEFDFDVEFGSHPCCRCTPVPVTKSWEELGIEGVAETKPTIEKGADWLARQDAETQAQILGPGKYKLFQEGELDPAELVGYRDDPKWGPVRFEKSLQGLTGN